MAGKAITQKGDFHLDKAFLKLQKTKPQLPKIMGNIAKNHFVAGFNKQGRTTEGNKSGWKKRAFNTGTNSKILVRSGTLRSDIKIKRANFGRIVVGTSSITKNYATIQNEGGDITVTDKMRKYFFAKYKSTGKQAYLAMALKKAGSTITIPKREYIGKSNKLEQKVKARLYQDLNKIFPAAAVRGKI